MGKAVSNKTFENDIYDQIRSELLSLNFALKQTLIGLRVRYGIPSKGFRLRLEYDSWFGKTAVKEPNKLEEIYKKCNNLANYLNIDPQLLISLFFFQDSRLFQSNWYIYSVGLTFPGGYKTGPITQEGVYMRLNPYMSKSDVLKAYKQGKPTISLFYKDLDIRPSKVRKDLGYNLEQYKKTYLEIESLLMKFYTKAIKDEPWQKEDKHKVLLDRVLEEMVSNQNYSDITKENKLKFKLKNEYYALINRFYLPTLSDLHKLELCIF